MICSAIEYAPWFDEPYTLKVKPSWAWQTYDKLALSNSTISYKSYDQFYSVNALAFPSEKWSIELELEAFQTSQHSFNFEYGSLCARRLILDDISGEDFFSLALGATFSLPTRDAIEDLSTFHHWYFDSEVHLAIGKEFTCQDTWDQRAWALVGLATGSHGSAWLHSLAVYEKNFFDEHELRIYGEYLYGFGQENIVDPEVFNGYARIAHRSFDLGLGYSYDWFPYMKFTLDYTQRVYARNFPDNAKSIIASIWIPLSF